MYDETTSGQHVELSWVQNKRWDLSHNDYFEMCRKKTAWYTCMTPAWIGALIAGADVKFRDIIFDFGMDLGIAFQIQDDVLNLIGDEKIYGKEIGGDLWEGKRTLITIDLMKKANISESLFLREAFDMPRADKKKADIDKIMSIIKKYGCIDNAMTISIELATRARSGFARLDGSIDTAQREIILELIDFMIDRKF
jgi:geranylgeranyl diphosphate synthase type II